jgi:hypothetical protein
MGLMRKHPPGGRFSGIVGYPKGESGPSRALTVGIGMLARILLAAIRERRLALEAKDLVASARALLDFDRHFSAGSNLLDGLMLDLHRINFLLEVSMSAQEVDLLANLQRLVTAQHSNVDFAVEVDNLTYLFAIRHRKLLSICAARIKRIGRNSSSSSIVHFRIVSRKAPCRHASREAD